MEFDEFMVFRSGMFTNESGFLAISHLKNVPHLSAVCCMT